MSFKRSISLTAALIAAFSSSATLAAPLTIDGNLGDWGISVADNNASDFTHLKTDIGLLGFHLEDQNDLAANGAYLGPQYGGQNYDAEFMGVARQGGTLYIAIVTGQRPDNGFSNYSPGDIRISTSDGLIGIEVGGGAGGGSGTALSEGASGSTYGLKSNGYTLSHGSTQAAQTAGSVWSDVDWILDPIGPVQEKVQFSINGASQQLGSADFIFTRNGVTGQHAIIELAISTSLFGASTLESIFWAPSCGNDELSVSMPVRITQVPEPAALGLFGLGLLAMGVQRRRRRATA